MIKNVKCPGSATIINAIATGFGSAFGIGLNIKCRAKSIDSTIKCFNDVGASTDLMDLCVKKVFDKYDNLNYENAKLNPKYTFETFVVGNNNKFAHSAALAVAESPGNTYNPLYLYLILLYLRFLLYMSLDLKLIFLHPSYMLLYINLTFSTLFYQSSHQFLLILKLLS